MNGGPVKYNIEIPGCLMLIIMMVAAFAGAWSICWMIVNWP